MSTQTWNVQYIALGLSLWDDFIMTSQIHPNDWVPLMTFSNRQEAEIARLHLESLEIQTQVFVDDVGGIYPSLGMLSGARLLVQSKNLDEALLILESPQLNE